MKKKNFPSGIVNMGSLVEKNPKTASIDYYRKLGFSLSTAEVLANKNKHGYPIEEFYWLDQKWWSFYTGESKKIIEEIRDIVGGAFVKLSLSDQCSLLDIPFYSALKAPIDATSRAKKKWLLNNCLVTPEEYVLSIINREYEIVVADEGAHINAWLPMFYNLYLDCRVELGKPRFREGWGSDSSKRLERTEVIELANTYSDTDFYRLTKEQIEKQIAESWWPNSYGVEETMAASKSWGKDNILRFSDLNMWPAGIPDIMGFKNGRHTFIEVKTTDRLHQSQAFFIRNSKTPMRLDIRVVQLIASSDCNEGSNADILSWLQGGKS